MARIITVVVAVNLAFLTQSKAFTRTGVIQQPATNRITTTKSETRSETAKKEALMQKTVKEVLGISSVDVVVKDVISRETKRVSASYILTEDSFGRLRES